jgi:hypothetical protein
MDCFRDDYWRFDFGDGKAIKTELYLNTLVPFSCHFFVSQILRWNNLV